MTQTWTTLAVLDWTTKRFTEAGIGAARLEAQVLLAHALQCTRMQLYTGFDKPLGDAELASYRELIKRRLAGEPVAYLVSEHEFWGLPLTIDPSVLGTAVTPIRRSMVGRVLVRPNATSSHDSPANFASTGLLTITTPLPGSAYHAHCVPSGASISVSSRLPSVRERKPIAF